MHTPRVQQGKRLISVTRATHTQTEQRPPPTSVKPVNNKTTASVQVCTHGEQMGAGVCVRVFVCARVRKSNRVCLNQQACLLTLHRFVFISKQKYCRDRKRLRWFMTMASLTTAANYVLLISQSIIIFFVWVIKKSGVAWKSPKMQRCVIIHCQRL